MTHLPFIAAAYTLGIGVPVGFALASWRRLRRARRRLEAVDPRARDALGARARSSDVPA